MPELAPIYGYAGPDGVGKTTQAKLLSIALGGVSIRTLMQAPDHVEMYQALELQRVAVNDQPDAGVRFHHAWNYLEWQMELARQKAEEGKPVVLDATIHDAVAEQCVHGTAVDLSEFQHLIPDRTFLLELDSEALDERRLAMDGNLHGPWEWDKRLYEDRDALWGEYHRFGLPTLDASLPAYVLRKAALEQLGV